MNLHQILARHYLIFSNEETDMLIAWDGGCAFSVFFGKFNGDYDNVDDFYREVKTVDGAREAARAWLQEHSTFNPGP